MVGTRDLLSLRSRMEKIIQGILSMLLYLITAPVSFSITKDKIISMGFLLSLTNKYISIICKMVVKSLAIFKKHMILLCY